MIERARRLDLGCAGVTAAIVLLVLLLPPIIYAYLSYRQFGFLRITAYAPYEELKATLTSGDAIALFGAPILSVNMTSGDMLANMYSLTVGQLFLSLALAATMSLSLCMQLAARSACSARAAGGVAAGASSGLLATVAASSTGLIGCCGSALSGGVLALAGVSATTADQLARVSPILQGLMIALFLLHYLRLRKRLADGQDGPPATASPAPAE